MRREKKEEKELRGLVIVLSFFAIIAVFGNSAIEFIGEAKCYAVANAIGEFFAPFFGVGCIFMILYFFGYFFFILPGKIFRRLKSR